MPILPILATKRTFESVYSRILSMLALEGQCSDSKVTKYKGARFHIRVSSQLTAIIPPRIYVKKTCGQKLPTMPYAIL